MGIRIGMSRASYDDKPCKTIKVDVNPNPINYKIIMHKQFGGYLLILINYPNCTNYEGNKILLYKGIDYTTLLKQKYIDPHFSENKNFASPIARFEPTSFGWEIAETLMKTLAT